MEIITDAIAIRQRLQTLLADPDDRRVIVVGFVGGDALDLLANPQGLEFYCWPRAGATNPYAIQALCDAGARVHFVERLHARVYWSQAHGALIGSANLSATGLAEEAGHEAMVALAPGAMDMDAFLAGLHPLPTAEFHWRLEQLRIEHICHLQRNHGFLDPQLTGEAPPPPSFEEWMANRPDPQSWRLGWYPLAAPAPADAVEGFLHHTGAPAFEEYLGVEAVAHLSIGVPVLGFLVDQQDGEIRMDHPRWWFPEYYSRTDQPEWQPYEYLWFARTAIPRGARVPFEVGSARFQQALKAAIEDLGGVDGLASVTRKDSLIPKKPFLERILKHYRQQRD